MLPTWALVTEPQKMKLVFLSELASWGCKGKSGVPPGERIWVYRVSNNGKVLFEKKGS